MGVVIRTDAGEFALEKIRTVHRLPSGRLVVIGTDHRRQVLNGIAATQMWAQMNEHSISPERSLRGTAELVPSGESSSPQDDWRRE